MSQVIFIQILLNNPDQYLITPGETGTTQTNLNINPLFNSSIHHKQRFIFSGSKQLQIPGIINISGLSIIQTEQK